jgi:Leucine-rich repeat (LRR) protein
MSDPNDSTSTDDCVPLSDNFLEFCDRVRNNDPSILPGFHMPFIIRSLSEKEDIELANALLENTNVTYLEMNTAEYTKRSAEAMAKYVRTSKHLQRIRWNGELRRNAQGQQQQRYQEQMLFYFLLPAFQESTSLKELDIDFPREGELSNPSFENMLTHTRSLQSLILRCPAGPLEDLAVAVISSGLKKNTTLRELTLEVSRNVATTLSIYTSLCDHPYLRRLCLRGSLRGDVVDLTGLDTVLLSDNSQITELDIERSRYGPPTRMMGLTHILRALARRPTLTKLRLCHCALGRDDAILLRLVLGSTPSLQSLDLANTFLGRYGFRELAPVLHHNTSIKEVDLSYNNLSDMESAEGLRRILLHNKTLTTLDLSWNTFGQTDGAVERIADGLGSNSTLLKIDLSFCALGDGGVSILTQTLGSRNTALQKLNLGYNLITSTGAGMLLETMEQSSHHITDLDLQQNPVGNEGASLLAAALGNDALPNLTNLGLRYCDIGDDGFIALLSALEQNTSLLQLNLRENYNIGARVFLALVKSLPTIKVLQRIVLSWCTGLASAMPLLLAGLRKNTSLFRFHVRGCTSYSVPLQTEEMARCAGGWMQEMESLGYRNRFLSLTRATTESLPPRGIYSHALARVALKPDVIFEVLRSIPSLVPSTDKGGKEAAKNGNVPMKRKHIDVES